MKKILLSCLMSLQLPLFAQAPRILPLGNSITQADNTHYSYRFWLWQKLRSINASFDFVGTMNTNYGGNPSFPDPGFDKDHEGHRGWRADQLLAALPSWLQNYTPDIVLVHAGTNDMFMGNSVSGTVEELKQIIDVLRADNPDVSILLAKIIGTTASENARIVQLNSYIDGIAASKNTTRSRIIVVDQYADFNPSVDTYDGKHPNAAGEKKMAQKWFNALMTIMDVESPTIPQHVTASAITQNSFTLSWERSSDNKGVTAYQIYRDGVAIGKTSQTSFVVGGLSPANVYSMTVTAGDAAGNRSSHSSELSVTTVSSSAGEGTGLTAQYYNSLDLSGSVVLGRLEPQVNFSWGYGSPGAEVNTNYFSARWTGSVQAPVSGNYIFSTVSDDGVRLWVNNALVINNWTDHGSTTNSSQSVVLAAGVRYDIRMEYYEKGGAAVAKLLWTYPGQTQHVMPQGRLYPLASAGDIEAPTTPNSLASSNITPYGFTLSWAPSTDNQSVTGYEVFIDGKSFGTVAAVTRTISGLSSSTVYAATVRARDAAGNWSAQSNRLTVTTAAGSTGAGTGLSGSYYNTIDLAGPAVFSREEPQVNFSWGYGSPAAVVNRDYFSARWSGTVEPPVSGNYTFSTVSDDGVRLWVNNVLVINNWTDHGSTTNNSHSVALTAGVRYDIRMEYYEKGGAAVARLLWTYPGQSQQSIPQRQLYPLSRDENEEPPTASGAGLSGSYYNTTDLSGSVVLNRVEPVNFDWRYSSPDAPVNMDNFSVRWTGSVMAPVTGNYTFSTTSDDGVRLWVNDNLVIDNWTDHGSTTNNSSPLALSAGIRYAIRMEYYEKSSVAVARLHWTYPGKTRHAIEAGYLYPDHAPVSSARVSTVVQSLPDENLASAITVQEVPEQLRNVAVYPNPSHGENIRIAFYSDVNQTSEIVIVSAHGASVVRLRKYLMEGYNVVEIPASPLDNGIYFVLIANGSRRFMARFAVAK